MSGVLFMANCFSWLSELWPLAAFFLAAAIAFFHGAEYIERNKLNGGPGANEAQFYPSWPQVNYFDFFLFYLSIDLESDAIASGECISVNI